MGGLLTLLEGPNCVIFCNFECFLAYDKVVFCCCQIWCFGGGLCGGPRGGTLHHLWVWLIGVTGHVTYGCII